MITSSSLADGTVQRVEVDDVEPGRSGPYATTEARDIDVVVTSYNPH